MLAQYLRNGWKISANFLEGGLGGTAWLRGYLARFRYFFGGLKVEYKQVLEQVLIILM